MTPLPRRGHLYWVDLDKRRPALVVSPDVRNARASDVIVIPCTTVLRPSPTHVHLRRGEAGLPFASMLKCEQITTLVQSDIDGEALGEALSGPKMMEVERCVLRAIGVFVPM